MNESLGVAACVAALQSGECSARELTTQSLDRIARCDPSLHVFTRVTTDRALAEADAIDRMRQHGRTLPPLAGVPYTVKNLFDLAGETTLAGARLHAGRPPANEDAALVQKMQQAGAILLGAVNMDAYAYGFTTENTHYGTTRNPRDLQRVAGGSSGGSAAAVAAGMGACSLASDTNGSIRVPASFCGLFGLKPTFGRLSRHGSFPFVPSLDHLGPLARSARDLALVYDALQGPDSRDPACAQRLPEPTLPALERGGEGLRVGVLGGWFERCTDADGRAAVARTATLLGASDVVEWPQAELARAAAFVITAAEAGAFYLDDLRTRPDEFEPLTRERFVAGALLPAAWLVKAQRFRRWFADAVEQSFKRFDLLIAPATPCVATRIGQATIRIDGREVPTRPNIGLLTQPVSCIGLPVAVVPVQTASGLPIGVQLIAAPWRENLCLRAAWQLEQAGLAMSLVMENAND